MNNIVTDLIGKRVVVTRDVQASAIGRRFEYETISLTGIVRAAAIRDPLVGDKPDFGIMFVLELDHGQRLTPTTAKDVQSTRGQLSAFVMRIGMTIAVVVDEDDEHERSEEAHDMLFFSMHEDLRDVCRTIVEEHDDVRAISQANVELLRKAITP